jgi:hypothetical protein
MTDQLELMVKYLVHLQFYSEEEDVIFSRDKKHRVSIKGAGPVVAAFEDVFMRNIHLIRRKEFRAFLEEVAKTVPFDIEPVLIQFLRSVREIGSHNLTDELAANFLIGPIRSALQTREFDSCIYNVRRDAIARFGGNNAKQIVDEKLSGYYSRNDFLISMLHNLAFLKLLADLFGDLETQDRVGIVCDKFCQDLVDKLSENAQ